MDGKFYGTTKEDEEAKLEFIQEIAKEKLEKTRQNVQDLQNELNELREVYDVEDKEGLAQWFNTDARYSQVRNDLLRAERTKKKPYFGRIDIIDNDEQKQETFYIGKAVIARKPSEPEVIDWRAPIASVYYDHALGVCTYKVPREGIFEVDLKRKRTYEIEGDTLKDFYDSDVVANDDLLTKYLSKSKRNVLSEIIATIQQEQNEVIRKNPRHNVLIQGSAGSGKTTVAMHRISYILYNYELEFKPKDFYIVGSNQVLLNYITGVLPDLDVYGVEQMTMESLFVRLLYEDWNPKKHKIRYFDKKEKSIGIKGSTKWFEALSEFCKTKEDELLPKDDIVIERKDSSKKVVIMTAEEIAENVSENRERWTLLRKIERLNDLLQSHIETELFGKYYSYSVEEQKYINHHFKNYFEKFMYAGSSFDLYEEFLEKQRGSRPEIVYIKDTPDLYDLASIAYIYKRLKETQVIQEASHVVIDEAQDFGMMVYRSLKYCLSKCTFTIMGDVSQNINFDCGLGDWEELKEVMLPDRYDYFGLLRKSYRNTVEISQFATDILRHGTFPIYPVEPIVRHGNDVEIKGAASDGEMMDLLLSKTLQMQKEKYETIAIICADRAETDNVYDFLSRHTEVKKFEMDAEFTGGVMVLPIEYSKGLEFDAVIICNASEEAYPKDDGHAKLLYVAATRALHELCVLYKGSLTGLIADPIPEDRKNITFEEDTYHLKPVVFEEEFKTKEEIAREQTLLGREERALRDKFGPAKIVPQMVKNFGDAASDAYVRAHATTQNKEATSSNLKERPKAIIKAGISDAIKTKVAFEREAANASKEKVKKNSSEFYTSPEGTSLSPIGHGKIDTSVIWINADKEKVDFTCPYGTLRIIPLGAETVRIMFFKTLPKVIKNESDNKVKWNVRESREKVEILLEKLTVCVERKTGILSFIGQSGQLLLSEKASPNRQYHVNETIWWQYFNWSKREMLSAENVNEGDWKDITGQAKYISYGVDSLKKPVILSNKGYQIIIPAGIKTLACTIGAYGPYIRFDGTDCIDYTFRTAR